jgi:hypothetical protein
MLCTETPLGDADRHSIASVADGIDAEAEVLEHLLSEELEEVIAAPPSWAIRQLTRMGIRSRPGSWRSPTPRGRTCTRSSLNVFRLYQPTSL